MQRITLAAFIALAALLAACSAQGRDAAGGSSSLRLRADSELIEHIRLLAPRLDGDTLHLYSPGRDTTGPMSGRELSAPDCQFFRPFYANMTGDRDLFAVGYTAIGPGLTAYILRVPSQYSPSAIALWIHQDGKGYWLPPLEVANAFGDAGWSFQQDAWLVDRDHDGYRDLVQRRTDWGDDRALADSLSWRFWQSRFDQFGWRQDLTDRTAASVFSLRPRRP
jgi:hypothetical protein